MTNPHLVEELEHGPQKSEGWTAFAIMGAVVFLGAIINWRDAKKIREQRQNSR